MVIYVDPEIQRDMLCRMFRDSWVIDTPHTTYISWYLPDGVRAVNKSAPEEFIGVLPMKDVLDKIMEATYNDRNYITLFDG